VVEMKVKCTAPQATAIKSNIDQQTYHILALDRSSAHLAPQAFNSFRVYAKPQLDAEEVESLTMVIN
jgi:hypothetical protein